MQCEPNQILLSPTDKQVSASVNKQLASINKRSPGVMRELSFNAAERRGRRLRFAGTSRQLSRRKLARSLDMFLFTS